jgi:hypothetical protein
LSGSNACSSIRNYSADNAATQPEKLPREAAAMTSEPIRLPKNDIFVGSLQNIIEPDGEDFILAMVEGELLELSRALADKLRSLMGKRVIVGNVAGQIRAEART